MTQNIITLIIVFSTAAYVIFNLINSILHKKSKCDGCHGCDMKTMIANKQKEKTFIMDRTRI
jgi:hypothetical protein